MSERAQCECCGLLPPPGWTPTELIDRRTGEADSAWLCGACLSGQDRAWRLRWRIPGEIELTEWELADRERRRRAAARRRGKDRR